MIEQDSRMKHWRPDEVAECIGGLGDNIYRRLWMLQVDEPQTEEPVVQTYSWWDKLSDEDRVHINEMFRREFGELS